MLTSDSSQIEKCPTSENLFLLRRDWSDRAGKISTVRAGSRTRWWSFAIVEPGVRWPSAKMKTLVDGWPVRIKGSPNMPALEVHDVSWAAEGIEPSRTPSSRSFSVSILGFESVKGVGILEAPMALAFHRSRDSRRRVPLDGATTAEAADDALSADFSARHCRPGCRNLYSRKMPLD